MKTDNNEKTGDNGTNGNVDAGAGFQALMYQLLETELGGVKVYTTALKCAQNEDFKKELEEYLEQTTQHVQIATDLLTSMGLDPEQDTPARLVARHIGKSLVRAMEMALQNGTPAEAELTAAECVVHAETKDHMDWELVGMISERSKGESKDAIKAMKEAYEQVEKQEDHHLYHSMGWARELWIQAVGLPAVLPPPEEEKDVETMIGAARAKASRDQLM